MSDLQARASVLQSHSFHCIVPCGGKQTAINTTRTIMKTTIIGILTIVSAVSFAAISFMKSGAFDIGVLITATTAGIGLIKAADATK